MIAIIFSSVMSNTYCPSSVRHFHFQIRVHLRFLCIHILFILLLRGSEAELTLQMETELLKYEIH